MAYRIAGGVLVGLSVLVGGMACGGGGKPPADATKVPPSSILLASPPQGFSAHHLGAPYDANFELLGGKAGRNLFPKASVHQAPQNRLDTEVEVARDREHLAAHASAWGLASADLAVSHDKTYVSRRLVEVKDVIELDETTGARSAPEGAVYYPSKVYVGWSYEVVCQVDRSLLDADAEAGFLLARAKAEALFKKEDARCRGLGLGVEFDSRKAIFAKSIEEVGRKFRSSSPVPVLVEWRRIPGRKGHQDPEPKAGCAGTAGCERCEAWEFAHLSWTIPERDSHGAKWDVDDSPPDVQVTVRGPEGILLSSPEFQSFALDWMLDKPVRLKTGSKLILDASDRDTMAHDPVATISSEPLPAFLPDSTWELAGGQVALHGRCVQPD